MTTRRPFRLGVTGGIASGKSTVMRRLAELGAETVDSDVTYHGLIQPGAPLFQAVVGRWGDRVVAPDGTLDRKALGAIVFANPDELAALDALTHPTIRRATDAMYEVSTAEVFAVDAVKLIESGHADACDAVWLVVADPETQIRRLVDRRRIAPDDAARRVAAQPPVEEKIDRADTVLRNDGTVRELMAAVDSAWAALPLDGPRKAEMVAAAPV
ncbi:MAG TPA: dephospho-CoA kinase [Thermomicrobiales bacterium]|jgi:dephospho-CoA kinase|nr:dephospho-CoA kinase [Thermomicrobiales bacterium]